MKKLIFSLSVIMLMLFSCIGFAAPEPTLKIVVGPFEDVATKSIWTGGKEGTTNTELGMLTAGSATSYISEELINSKRFIVPGRRTRNESGVDLYVSGDVTNCAVKVSNIGYENYNHESSIENRKYTINIDIVVFVEDYESERMLFSVKGHGESSCTGTDVKYAEHTVKVGAERVTDDSINSGMQKACKEAVQSIIKVLKKQGRLQ